MLIVKDNTALSLASDHAQRHNHPLLVLFPFNPAEWTAHDRSRRRIDFLFRNLRSLVDPLSKLNIPLLCLSVPPSEPRHRLPKTVMAWVESVGAGSVWANMSYEVDELERDIEFCRLSKAKDLYFGCKHDRLMIEPGGVKKKGKDDGSVYKVFSPWFKVWSAMIGDHPELLKMKDEPEANDAKEMAKDEWQKLTKGMEIPETVEGWELEEKDKAMMALVHPEGEETAMQVSLVSFFSTCNHLMSRVDIS